MNIKYFFKIKYKDYIQSVQNLRRQCSIFLVELFYLLPKPLCIYFFTWHQFDVSFSYNQDRKKTAATLQHPVQVNTCFGAEMASAHDWSLVNITGSSSAISHLHCVLSLHTAARRLSPPPLIFLFLPKFLCSFYTPPQTRPASKAFLSRFMGVGGENRLNKKEKGRVPCRM